MSVMQLLISDGDDCTKTYDVLRTGLPGIHAYGLEELFFKFGVDLNLFAHEHRYDDDADDQF